jgi:hypothetical protein
MPIIDWNLCRPLTSGRDDRLEQFIRALRKNRWFTNSAAAEASSAIYEHVGANRSGTSILGIINGFLPRRFGIVLVAEQDLETGSHVGLALRRAWWDA